MSNTTHPESGNEESRTPAAPSVTPRAVTAALQRAGSSAAVTTCKAIEQLTENHLYEIDLDGRAAALRVWAVASQAPRRCAADARAPLGLVWPARPGRAAACWRDARSQQAPCGRAGGSRGSTRAQLHAETPDGGLRRVCGRHGPDRGDNARERPGTGGSRLSGDDLAQEPRDVHNGTWTSRMRAIGVGRSLPASPPPRAHSRRSATSPCCPWALSTAVPGPTACWSTTVGSARSSTLDRLTTTSSCSTSPHIVSQWGVLADSEQTNHIDPTLVRRIIRGYCSVRPLSHAERRGAGAGRAPALRPLTGCASGGSWARDGRPSRGTSTWVLLHGTA